MSSKFQCTHARKAYKTVFWWSNHHLITALVWTSAIGNWDIDDWFYWYKKYWNPSDMCKSSELAAQFILSSFLWWAVDSLDMYITLLYRKPRLYGPDMEVDSIYSTHSRSVHNKIFLLSEKFQVSEVLKASLDMLIVWRNNIFHRFADMPIEQSSRKVLLFNSDDLKNRYWIDVQALINKTESWSFVLTFQEWLFLIRSAHDFVKAFDKIIIDKLDHESLCVSIIKDELKSNISFRQTFYWSAPCRRRDKVLGVYRQKTGLTFDLKNSNLDNCIESFMETGH